MNGEVLTGVRGEGERAVGWEGVECSDGDCSNEGRGRKGKRRAERLARDETRRDA